MQTELIYIQAKVGFNPISWTISWIKAVSQVQWIGFFELNIYWNFKLLKCINESDLTPIKWNEEMMFIWKTIIYKRQLNFYLSLWFASTILAICIVCVCVRESETNLARDDSRNVCLAAYSLFRKLSIATMLRINKPNPKMKCIEICMWCISIHSVHFRRFCVNFECLYITKIA